MKMGNLLNSNYVKIELLHLYVYLVLVATSIFSSHFCSFQFAFSITSQNSTSTGPVLSVSNLAFNSRDLIAFYNEGASVTNNTSLSIDMIALCCRLGNCLFFCTYIFQPLFGSIPQKKIISFENKFQIEFIFK